VAGPRLKSELDRQRNLRNIPGIAAAVMFPDGSMWSAGSGYAKLPSRTASKNSTPYVVGSITKTFITAAVMQLDDEGVLSIDDPLSNWLPDYPRAAETTLRHLLSHTSGVHNYFEHSSYNSKVFNTMKTHFWTPEEILTTFAAAPYFAPGDGFRYSNTNFVLLGLVIESVTGKSLDDVMAERFFAPLSMTNSYFQYESPPAPSSAQGYLLTRSGVFREISDTTGYRPQISAATVAWAAGNIVAGPRDIARWADALYGGAGAVVSDESLAEMVDYDYSNYARGTYGLGTRTRTYNGHRMFGHTGSLRGFSAAMWYYADLDVTVVVLTNRGRIDANPIADVLASIATSSLP
jgi:D-alanyl-D-alanine carboxypeptidase